MLDNYSVVDIETTGLSIKGNRITEIAALKVSGTRIVDKFEMLVNPEVKIPAEITQLTGIDNNLVRKQKTIDKVLPKFLDFLGDSIVVAHNATFDYNFLDYNINKYLNKNLKNKSLCTVKLARKLFPDIISCRLSSLCNYFDIENVNAHRAMSDCFVTNKLFLKFQAIMHNHGIENEESIFEFVSTPSKKLNLCVSNFT